MRLKVEIDDLTPDQWATAQEVLRESYDIPERANRMCLTLVHGDEERHVEAPAGMLTGLLLSMAIRPTLQIIHSAMGHLLDPFNPVVVATLTPDDDRLPK